MDSNESKSNPKREHENDENPEPKRQRPDSPVAELPMKITGMNDACLEKIFDRLDLVSLFNVAVANEWLRPAARIVYNRRFGNNRVNLVAAKKICELFEDDNIIHVIGLKMCLQYMRCFGSSISRIQISYLDFNNKRCQFIHQYINKYCVASLESIMFINKSSTRVLHFEKPMVNLRYVVVSSTDLGNQLASFPQWFPNVRLLMLKDVRMDGGFFEIPFTQLQHLTIEIVRRYRSNEISGKDLSQLLGSNRQLAALDIRTLNYQVHLTTLLSMIKENRMIQKLVVSMDTAPSVVNPSEIKRLIDEHPIMSELDFQSYIFTADTATALVRQLHSLTKFRFQMNSTSDYDRFVADLDNGWHANLFTDFYQCHIVTVTR